VRCAGVKYKTVNIFGAVCGSKIIKKNLLCGGRSKIKNRSSICSVVVLVRSVGVKKNKN
jgi:hypothetical protein